MGRILPLVAAPLLFLAIACGGDRPGGSPTATGIPTATPTPSAWLTYTDPGGLFSIDYPAHWYQEGPQFFSSDPRRTIGPPGLSPEIVKVEVNHYDARGSSGCGAALDIDPRTGSSTPTHGATQTTLGGLPAWEYTRFPGDPAIEGNLTRIHGVSIVYSGFCVIVGAYFTQSEPDEATFAKMLASFKFLPNPSPT
jgi:hypothetical protein